MNYKGVIIGESLRDTSVLKKLTILQSAVEPVTPRHKTPWIKQWTLHTVEIPEGKINEVTQVISRSFDPTHTSWYADFKNESYHFIIYPNKIFQVDLKHPDLYQDAKSYGVSIGIPEYQVDFVPNDILWKR